jgi:hypothetical protein
MTAQLDARYRRTDRLIACYFEAIRKQRRAVGWGFMTKYARLRTQNIHIAYSPVTDACGLPYIALAWSLMVSSSVWCLTFVQWFSAYLLVEYTSIISINRAQVFVQ